MEKKTRIILDTLRAERKAQKMSGSDMGLAKSHYSMLETGKCKMSVDNLVKFCDRLGITIKLSKDLI